MGVLDIVKYLCYNKDSGKATKRNADPLTQDF